MKNIIIRKVANEEEKRATYALRFDLYGHLGWIDQALFHCGEESDEYDTLPTTTHFIALEGNRPVGTIRLVGQSILPFPMEVPSGEGFALPSIQDLKVVSWAKVQASEVSRLMVRQDNGAPRHSISLGLLQVLCRETVLCGYNYWLQALDVLTYRLMLSYNFALCKYAHNKKFFGSMTVPTVMAVDWFFDRFKRVDQPMYDFFIQDINPEDVVAEATKTLEARLYVA